MGRVAQQDHGALVQGSDDEVFGKAFALGKFVEMSVTERFQDCVPGKNIRHDALLKSVAGHMPG